MPFTKLFEPILKTALAEHTTLEDSSVIDLVAQYATCQAKRSEEETPDFCDEDGCGCENGWFGLRHHPLNDYEDYLSCHDCGTSDPDCTCDDGKTENDYCVHEKSSCPMHDGCKCGVWANLTCVIHGFIYAKAQGYTETYDEWVEYIKKHELVTHSFHYEDYMDSDDEEEDEDKVDCNMEYCLVHEKNDGKYETLDLENEEIVCECKRCRRNYRLSKLKRKREA